MGVMGHGHLKILNPGKLYITNLHVNCVNEVNAIVDHDGIPLFREAMILGDIALYTNGYWEITQLFQHLRNMIQVIRWNLQEVQFSKRNFKISNI